MKSSVSSIRWGWVVATLIVAIAPLAARAGMGHRRCGQCGRCALPFSACHCAQPFCSMCQMAPSSCNCQQPAVIGQAPVTTLQPVVRTEIRRQAQVIDVPVTTHRQVTVDEGSYQTVWVPKMTTKTVAETTIQKQVRYQDVPYQVVQHVPVQQSVVASQVIVNPGMIAAAPQTIVAGTPVIAHGDHYHPLSGSSTSLLSPERLVPTPEPSLQASHSPVQIGMPQPAPLVTMPPAGIAAESSGSWSKVLPRQAAGPASNIQQQAYTVEVSTVSIERHAVPSTPLTRPTAAAAWQAQGAFRR